VAAGAEGAAQCAQLGAGIFQRARARAGVRARHPRGWRLRLQKQTLQQKHHKDIYRKNCHWRDRSRGECQWHWHWQESRTAELLRSCLRVEIPARRSLRPAPSMLLLAALLAAVAAPCGAAPLAVAATVDATHRLGALHGLHPAYTLDFWAAEDPAYGAKFGASSALAIDLASPALRAAARALAPALLRIGGAPQDSLVFDAGDGGPACAPGGGAGPFAPYFCSQVHPYTYACLTRARWLALLAFAADTGLQIVFGLNGCTGRASRHHAMNRSNAEALFAATAASPHAAALWGFELANENVPALIAPAAWAADAAALKAAAGAAFAAAGLAAPRFAGPDTACCDALAAVAAAAPRGTLDALTYHQYVDCEAGDAPGFALAPACLLKVDGKAADAAATARGGGVAGAWMGEGAGHRGGGVRGLTDSFRSTLYTAWHLGATAAAGVALTARQTLSGGDYEVLRRGDFAPNPDFWAYWLFKALAGNASLAVAHDAAPAATGVRVFAFAAAPATGARFLLLAVNLRIAEPASVTLGGDGVGGAARLEFHLSGELAARGGAVACNGAPLARDAATLAPPPWRALGARAEGGAPLLLAPASVAFALVL